MEIKDGKIKYILLKAVNQQDEATFFRILKFGAPRILHTDRRRSFEGTKLAH